MLSVPLVDRIEAGIALSLGVLKPRPPSLVLMFMRSFEWVGMVLLLVMDSMMCVLMLSKALAVVLSHASHDAPLQLDVSAWA